MSARRRAKSRNLTPGDLRRNGQLVTTLADTDGDPIGAHVYVLEDGDLALIYYAGPDLEVVMRSESSWRGGR